MKKLLLAAALLLMPTAALAQCNGVFPNNTLCGNITGSSNLPRPVSNSALTGVPGGSNGQTQYNNNGNFGGSSDLIANSFAGADIAAKINAAVAALPTTGGTITVNGGAYTNISTTITINKSVRLNLNGSTLTYTAGTAGFLCTGVSAAFSSIFNGSLIGSDVSLGTNDGVAIQCPFFNGTLFQVQGFGRDQISILSAPTIGGAFADNWQLNQILARNSFRDGFHVEGSDSNNGTCNGCEAQKFARYGFFDASFIGNIYNAPNADNLSLGGAGTAGFQLIGSAITVNGGYCEKSTNTANVGGNSNTFYNSAVAPCVLANTGGGAAFTNQLINYTTGGYPAFMNNLALGAIGDTNAFGWRINPSTAGQLQLRDLSSGTAIQTYDLATTAWTTVGTTQWQNAATFVGIVANPGMPTSCTAQPSGTLRNNSGVVNVCP